MKSIHLQEKAAEQSRPKSRLVKHKDKEAEANVNESQENSGADTPTTQSAPRSEKRFDKKRKVLKEGFARPKKFDYKGQDPPPCTDNSSSSNDNEN
jgi:hypothetical protein